MLIHVDDDMRFFENYGKYLEKMAKTMGININSISIDRMKTEGILEQLPDAAQASAFIYNGDIYINSDIATIDSVVPIASLS